MKDYAIDGLRLDTVTYVPRWFLEKFQQRAGVYIVGEVRALPNRGLLLTLGRTCAAAAAADVGVAVAVAVAVTVAPAPAPA